MSQWSQPFSIASGVRAVALLDTGGVWQRIVRGSVVVEVIPLDSCDAPTINDARARLIGKPLPMQIVGWESVTGSRNKTPIWEQSSAA